MRRIAMPAICMIATCALVGFVRPATAQRVQPYGFILVNSVYNHSGVTPMDVPVTASSKPATGKAFLITPRQTRIGLKAVPDTTLPLSARIEIDFWGLRGSIPPAGITQTSIRLRLAYLKYGPVDGLSVTVGQDWAPLAPYNPNTIAHQAITGCSGSGNLWARLPQIRVEQRWKPVLVQVAILRPHAADAPTTPVSQADQSGSGERSQRPFFQGRVAGFLGPLTVGVAGHMGQLEYSNGDEVKTIAVAGDLAFKYGPLTIHGELAHGQSVGMLFANTTTYTATVLDAGGDEVSQRKALKGLMGWGEMSWALSPSTSANVGGGIEKTDWDDANLGRGTVEQNRTTYANVMWRPWQPLRLALEADFIETTYRLNPSRRATALNLAAQLAF
jgi:hypothetical protein